MSVSVTFVLCSSVCQCQLFCELNKCKQLKESRHSILSGTYTNWNPQINRLDFSQKSQTSSSLTGNHFWQAQRRDSCFDSVHAAWQWRLTSPISSHCICTIIGGRPTVGSRYQAAAVAVVSHGIGRLWRTGGRRVQGHSMMNELYPLSRKQLLLLFIAP